MTSAIARVAILCQMNKLGHHESRNLLTKSTNIITIYGRIYVCNYFFFLSIDLYFHRRFFVDYIKNHNITYHITPTQQSAICETHLVKSNFFFMLTLYAS